jgi:hypothetical protein
LDGALVGGPGWATEGTCGLCDGLSAVALGGGLAGWAAGCWGIWGLGAGLCVASLGGSLVGGWGTTFEGLGGVPEGSLDGTSFAGLGGGIGRLALLLGMPADGHDQMVQPTAVVQQQYAWLSLSQCALHMYITNI